MAYANPEDQRAYWQVWYARNKDHHKVNSAKRAKELKAAIRSVIREAKAAPCMDCGNEFPYPAMDFDHVRGEKSFTIATSTWKYQNLQAVIDEIAKCDVVCSNCHRIRTHVRRFGDIV